MRDIMNNAAVLDAAEEESYCQCESCEGSGYSLSVGSGEEAEAELDLCEDCGGTGLVEYFDSYAVEDTEDDDLSTIAQL